MREDFFFENIRSRRKYDVAIVDEADSLLVDGVNNVVRLSSFTPGMSNLLPILSLIWFELEVIEGNFYGSESRDVECGEIATESYANSIFAQQFLFIILFLKHLKRFNQTNQIEDRKVNAKNFSCGPKRERQEVIDETLRRVKVILRTNEHFKEIISLNLYDFVLKNRLPIWTKNAYAAKHDFVLERDYIISDTAEVKIVDHLNTGVVHKNMKWADGLHQFLQLKHDVRLTSEELTTNFIGNPTYFLKYRCLYGLTGTVGCEFTRKFLSETFNTDTFTVPPFKPKKHIEFGPICVNSKEDWYENIIKSCRSILDNNQAVMVIAESILETKLLEERFRNFISNIDILLYQTDRDSGILRTPIEPCQVLLTTNIAGRGTNVFPSEEVNSNGGLHVCLTFLPQNTRVEMQNLGRTSRSGQPGSSQLILFDKSADVLEDLKKARHEENEGKLKALRSEIAKTKFKSDIFFKFCFIRKVIRHNEEPWVNELLEKSCLQQHIFERHITDEFGFWLKLNENRDLTSMSKEFELFLSGIRNPDSITNPYTFILSGNAHLTQKHYAKALKQYEKVESLSKSESLKIGFVLMSMAVAQSEIGSSFTNETLKRAKTQLLRENKAVLEVRNFIWSRKFSQNQYQFLRRKFEAKTHITKKAIRSIEDEPYFTRLKRFKVFNSPHTLSLKPWDKTLAVDEVKQYKNEILESIVDGFTATIGYDGKKWFHERAPCRIKAK